MVIYGSSKNVKSKIFFFMKNVDFDGASSILQKKKLVKKNFSSTLTITKRKLKFNQFFDFKIILK